MKTLPLIFFSLFIGLPAFAGEIAYDSEADTKCFNLYSSAQSPENMKAIIPVCTKAAQSGAQGSQYALGMMYLDTDRDQGLYWLQKAAKSGHPDAIKQLQKGSLEASPQNLEYFSL